MQVFSINLVVFLVFMIFVVSCCNLRAAGNACITSLAVRLTLYTVHCIVLYCCVCLLGKLNKQINTSLSATGVHGAQMKLWNCVMMVY